MYSKLQSVLVTGVTGYIGGRLVPRLLEAGYRVRVMVRDPLRLQGRTWLDRVKVVQGDVLKADTLDAALTGIDVAYYLIHSMRGGGVAPKSSFSICSRWRINGVAPIKWFIRNLCEILSGIDTQFYGF